MSDERLDKNIEVPRARSRAGDFIFAASAGVVAIIMALMVEGANFAVILIIVGSLFSALALRYFSLSDAPAVRAGTNVSEEQLETLARLRALINALPQPVMLLDENGLVERCNSACTDMFGANTVGTHFTGVVRTPKALEAVQMAERMGEPYETEVTLIGPPERTILFYAAPMETGPPANEKAMILMLRDRTEQKKLERMRTDFVANASHELRTPLTSMAGFIETLQGHARNDPAARDRFLDVMGTQAQRMLSLVEDLIGLSSIELNESKPLTDQFDLLVVAKNVVDMLQPIAELQKGSVVLKVHHESVPIVGDRHELFRLMQNLCDNALKYGVDPETAMAEVTIEIGSGVPAIRSKYRRTGDSPSQIAVRAGVEEKDLVYIQVADKGEGIDPNDLPRLTERFYRVNPEMSRAKGGTGLGLAIVKHILQRHKGGLQVESKVGEGAVFTVLLPLKAAADLPERHEDDKQSAQIAL